MRALKSAGLGLIAAMALAAPASAGTLDQQQTEDAELLFFGAPREVGQTFTAGLSGLLDQVDLKLEVDDATCDVTVQIRSVAGGLPDAALASTVVSGATLFGANSNIFHGITFANPAAVVAGTQYAIVLSAPKSPCAKVRDEPTNPYAAGSEVILFNTATDPWEDNSPYDLAFRTYVAPPPPPPGTARCSGLTATVVGTEGNDMIDGTPGRDVIAGLGGKDVVRGLAGKDRICGGRGKDTLKGGGGNDRLKGGASSDSLKGGGGTDRCAGGSGGDTARKCEVERST